MKIIINFLCAVLLFGIIPNHNAKANLLDSKKVIIQEEKEMTQTYKVQVSMNQAHIVESGFVWKQGDFGFNIEIEVLDFDTTGATPQIIFRKSTGAVEATQISVASNKFTYAIRGTELDTPGPCVCDLKLKDSTTKRVSTASFKYFVIPDTMDGLEQEASSYSDTIEQIVGGFDGKIADLKSECETIEKTTTEMVDTNIFDATNGYAGIIRYYENGSEISNANYYTTPYTELEQDTLYKIGTTNAHICLWDSNKNFIEGYLIAGSGIKTVNSKNAVYLSVSVPNNAKSTSYIKKLVSSHTKEIEGIQTNLSDTHKTIDLYNSHDVLNENKNFPAGTYTSNGITFIVDKYGNFTADGTATAEALLNLMNASTPITSYMERNKDYIGVIETGNANISLQAIAYAGGTIKNAPLNTKTRQVFKITDNTVTGLWIRLSVPSGTTLSNVSGRFMILNTESNENLSEYINGINTIVDKIIDLGEQIQTSFDINKNKLPEVTIYDDYIYYYENGNQYENVNYYTTDFIPCDANTEYGYTLYNTHICLWNANKTFIKGYLVAGADNNVNLHFNSENASYITLSIPKSNISTARFGELSVCDSKKPYQVGQIHFNIAVNAANMIETESSSTYADSVLMQNAPAVLILPRTYTATGRPVPLLMICHGSGYGVSDQNWGWGGNNDTAFSNFVKNFTDAGYAICDINGIGTGVQSTWGAPRAIQAYRKLYEYVTKNYNVQDKLNIYGFSMGGLVALNFTAHNKDIVKCIAIGAPVTSLYGQVYNWNKGRKETLAAFYNFTLPSGFVFSDGEATPEEIEIWNNNKEKTIGFDPTAKIILREGEPYMPFTYPPLRIWHAKDDASVPYEPSVYLVQAIRNANNYASVRLMTTGGHGISYGESDIATAEFIMWLNRFNQFD